MILILIIFGRTLSTETSLTQVFCLILLYIEERSILKILQTNQSFYENIWSLTFINERRWDLHFNQGLVVRLPSKDIKKAWEKIIKLQKNYNVLNLRLTEIDLRNPKQILGKINFDKKVILKRKHL